MTVAATARTRLALHREEVDLLHLIGATDSYIATQFQTTGLSVWRLRAPVRWPGYGAGHDGQSSPSSRTVSATGLIPGVNLTVVAMGHLCY
jgi:hypothetical protein